MSLCHLSFNRFNSTEAKFAPQDGYTHTPWAPTAAWLKAVSVYAMKVCTWTVVSYFLSSTLRQKKGSTANTVVNIRPRWYLLHHGIRSFTCHVPFEGNKITVSQRLWR